MYKVKQVNVNSDPVLSMPVASRLVNVPILVIYM